MNQFLIDGVPYRTVYCDNPNGFGEERGGCTSMQNGEFRLCEECEYRMNCPADGDEMLDAEARESHDVRDMHSVVDE